MANFESDQRTIEELIDEAGGLDNLPHDDRLYIEDLKRSLSLEEKAARLAEQEIRRARQYSARLSGAVALAEQQEDVLKIYQEVPINVADIGWIDGSEERMAQGRLVQPPEGPNYIFVDMTDMHRTTKDATVKLQGQSLGESSVYDEAMSQLVEHIIPLLDKNLKRGANARPVRGGVGHKKKSPKNGKDKSIATNYPAYKEGVMGTQNRAIILRLGTVTESETPVYGLAALYDHDDEGMIYRALNH